jgi:hypothetical protein
VNVRLRHAIEAAYVAAVGDADPQVVVYAPKLSTARLLHRQLRSIAPARGA